MLARRLGVFGNVKYVYVYDKYDLGGYCCSHWRVLDVTQK
jgi:hypothetical protein